MTRESGTRRSGDRSPDVVHQRPNTGQSGGAGMTKDQHETTRLRTSLNLQNLHPRFKSGRRLQSQTELTLSLAGGAFSRPAGDFCSTTGSARRLAKMATRDHAPGDTRDDRRPLSRRRPTLGGAGTFELGLDRARTVEAPGGHRILIGGCGRNHLGR